MLTMTVARTADDDYVAAVMAERPKLYHRASFSDGCVVVLPPGAVDDFTEDAGEKPVSIENIYLTDAEYEALPEFES